MKLPYGLADFYRLVTEGYAYVDRTGHLRTIEELGEALLFIRPRRFGKSLWLKTLKTYYDLRLAEEHSRLFGDLAIGRDPTPLAHRYFVLEWDFSAIAPHGDVDRIESRLESYVNGTVEAFLLDYGEHLPHPVAVTEDPVRTLTQLLATIRRTPYRLYLLVDEYDNFANEVMVTDRRTYHRLLHADGPFKALFKWVKSAMAGQGLERLFVTGVSPVVMSDLTSGLNITRGVYLHPQLADLCGFREAEVRSLTEELLAGREADARQRPAVDVEEALEMMRIWYDGYRFAPEATEAIYNPTLVLHFLTWMQERGKYPRRMLDPNLAADEDKLRYLGEIARGRELVAAVARSEEVVEVPYLEERFTLADLLDRDAQGETFLASLLYFFGMLTLAGETPHRKLRLTSPNLATQSLYVEALRRFMGLDPLGADAPVAALTRQGDVAPLVRFVESRLFPSFSNRDYLGMNERGVKILFLTLLFDDVNYALHSEPELERGYADLCLLLRADARSTPLWDLLFEFKYLGLDALGMTGEELRARQRPELEEHPAVQEAMRQAEAQLGRYARVLEKRSELRLRSYAVVALGFERLLVWHVSTVEGPG